MINLFKQKFKEQVERQIDVGLKLESIKTINAPIIKLNGQK